MSEQGTLMAEIVEDARAAHHIPGPWIETSPGTFVCDCERCGYEAIVIGDNCEIDNMQVTCGKDL